MGVEVDKSWHKNLVLAGDVTILAGNKASAVDNPLCGKAAALNFFFGKDPIKSRFVRGNNFPEHAVLDNK
jgi:hypothetical protein